MFTNQAKADVYDQITNTIIEAIEAGTEKYEMPWHCLHNPINAITRKLYRGVNVLMLWATAQKLGYAASEWATYRQWQDAGAQVRKGERSTTVVFWKFFDRNEEQQDESESQENRQRCFARAYNVFNAAQVDGYDPCDATTTLRSRAARECRPVLRATPSGRQARWRSRLLLTYRRLHPNARVLAIQISGRLCLHFGPRIFALERSSQSTQSRSVRTVRR